MGSYIEFNDTLQISDNQGFPKILKLRTHLKKPFTVSDFKGKIFSFVKPGMRIFHPAPNRVFLVNNIKGKWLYWGHVLIIEQTIDAKRKITKGKFIITKIYLPSHQRSMSINETNKGKEFFKN